MAHEARPDERGVFGLPKRLCANCAGAFDALRMKKAGGRYYCAECYRDLVETSKRRPPHAAAVPEEVTAELRASEAAKSNPALIAEAESVQAALDGAPAASPAATAPTEGADAAARLRSEVLEGRLALAEEVAAHAAREFWIDSGFMALKLVAYGGLIIAAVFTGGVARFALVGFFGADFFVWAVASFIVMPFSRTGVAVEFVAYLGLIIFFSSGADLIAAPRTNDEMAVTFLVFLATFFVKGCYHGFRMLDEFLGG